MTAETLSDIPPAPPSTQLRLLDTTGTYAAEATFFTAPVHCEDTCPITMEPLGASDGDVLFEDAPNLNAARLACGHCFNGKALVCHWMRNHMRCPLCREGGDFRLAALNFTGAWAVEWERKSRELAKREQLEVLRREEDIVRRLMHESLLPRDSLSIEFETHVVIDVFSLGDMPLSVGGDDTEPFVVHEMQTVVYFYTTEDGAPPHVLHNETVAMGFRDEYLASSPSTTRNLCRALSCFLPSHVRLTSYGVQLGGGIHILANSPLIPMQVLRHGADTSAMDPESGGVYRIQGTPGEIPGIGSICLDLPPRVRLIHLT